MRERENSSLFYACFVLSCYATCIRLCHFFYQQYSEIWALDEKDPFARPDSGESVDDVALRLANAISTMELENDG